MINGTKTCTKCKAEKSLADFAKHKRQKDGLQPACRACRAAECADWYRRNPEKQTQANNAWRRANRASFNGWLAERRARKRQAVPPWNDPAATKAVFDEAWRRRQAGEAVEVDHIVPLTSTLVCGLHWAGNLRVIDARENASKNNRWWPDMP